MKHSRIAPGIAALLLSVAPAAWAQNLLPNADFDDNLSGWSDTTGKTWSDDDSDGNASSGSMQLTLDDVGTDAISVCVPFTAGEFFELRVDVRLDIEQNAQGRAGIIARYMSDAQCSTQLANFPLNTFSTFAPDWITHSTATSAPAGTVALLVELRATKTGGTPGHTVTAYLDDAYLGSPAGEATCADPFPPYGDIATSDALHVLRSAVGLIVCDPCLCDVNGSGEVTTSDALTVLRAAVGNLETIDCPFC